jgi:hypothetical protein
MGNYIDKGVAIVEDITDVAGDTRLGLALCDTVEDTLGVLGEGVCAVSAALSVLSQGEGKPELSVEFTATEDGEFIVISTANTDTDDDTDVDTDVDAGGIDGSRRIDSNGESYHSV